MCIFKTSCFLPAWGNTFLRWSFQDCRVVILRFRHQISHMKINDKNSELTLSQGTSSLYHNFIDVFEYTDLKTSLSYFHEPKAHISICLPGLMYVKCVEIKFLLARSWQLTKHTGCYWFWGGETELSVLLVVSQHSSQGDCDLCGCSAAFRTEQHPALSTGWSRINVYMSYILAGFFLNLNINVFFPRCFPLNKISVLECHIKIQRSWYVGIRSWFFNVMSWKTLKQGMYVYSLAHWVSDTPSRYREKSWKLVIFYFETV